MENPTPDSIRKSLDARTTFFDENRRGERPIDAEYVEVICGTFLRIQAEYNNLGATSNEYIEHAKGLLRTMVSLNNGLTSIMVDGPLFETMETVILADLKPKQ